MSDPHPTGASGESSGQMPRWRQLLRAAENGLSVMFLAGLVILPLAEAILRKVTGGRFGITGASDFAQHFTLLIGVLGGALAARDNRLLSLSTLPNRLSGRRREIAHAFGQIFAAAVTALIAIAAWQFVRSEPVDKLLGYGVPRRLFQWFLPAGFGLVTLRLCCLASHRAIGRILAALIVAAAVWFVLKTPVDPIRLVWPSLVVLLLAAVTGAPIFAILGGAAAILLWGSGRMISLIPLEHYYLVTDAVLPSIPLFTLAGYLLAEGGASQRLVRLFQALVGSVRGGPGIVTALVCAFFTSFTGASGVTILALGGLLMPVLRQAHYSEKSALGLITGAGSLGMLFPPCLPLILYSVIAQRTMQTMEFPPGTTPPEVTINQLFLGGLGPGLLMVILTAWWAVREGPRDRADRPKFKPAEVGAALWDAKWELFLPVLVLGVMFAGLVTAVEASALAALYAFFTQVVAHRDLKVFKDLPRVMTECALLVGGVLLILGVAMGLTKFLILADVPTLGAEWMRETIHSPWLFLLLLNLFLLVVGCLMDVYSAIVVVVPLIVPMGLAFAIDPIHLGIIFLANLQLGFLTPPVGMNLFLSSYRFNKPMPYVIRATIPMLLVLLIGVLLITYLPPLTTWLPRLFK